MIQIQSLNQGVHINNYGEHVLFPKNRINIKAVSDVIELNAKDVNILKDYISNISTPVHSSLSDLLDKLSQIFYESTGVNFNNNNVKLGLIEHPLAGTCYGLQYFYLGDTNTHNLFGPAYPYEISLLLHEDYGVFLRTYYNPYKDIDEMSEFFTSTTFSGINSVFGEVMVELSHDADRVAIGKPDFGYQRIITDKNETLMVKEKLDYNNYTSLPSAYIDLPTKFNEEGLIIKNYNVEPTQIYREISPTQYELFPSSRIVLPEIDVAADDYYFTLVDKNEHDLITSIPPYKEIEIFNENNQFHQTDYHIYINAENSVYKLPTSFKYAKLKKHVNDRFRLENCYFEAGLELDFNFSEYIIPLFSNSYLYAMKWLNIRLQGYNVPEPIIVEVYHEADVDLPAHVYFSRTFTDGFITHEMLHLVRPTDLFLKIKTVSNLPATNMIGIMPTWTGEFCEYSNYQI